ncbi:hypothetical protein FHG87_015551 [Trinorchestia longiramus]|nr:hypothetical protein FHG87_015551 [Trinorchestia longiramus]
MNMYLCFLGSSNSVLPCYGTDVHQSVILTCLYPSIAITHSVKHNSVSVWRTRRCNMEENAAMVHNCSFPGDLVCEESTAALNITSKSGLPTPLLPHTAASPAPPLHFTPSRSFTLNHTSLNFTPSQQSQMNFTPIQFTSSRFTPTQFTPAATLHITPKALSPNTDPSPHRFPLFASPAVGTPVARHSPIYSSVKTPVNARLRSVLTTADRITPKQRKALFTRTPSPLCVSAQHARLGPTPSPRAPRSTLPGTPAPSALNDSLGEVDPLIPDLCLELLWTDQTAVKPRSAFLTEDCVGQRFLCLLVNNLLRVIKYEHTNDFTSLVFGSCAAIAVKDAVPLTQLRMILVIDCADSLCLYSGTVQVCNINITQSSLPLNTTLFKDFSSLNISSQLIGSVETPLRRSSLLPSKRNAPLLDEKLTLSPVVSEKPIAGKLFDAESADQQVSTSIIESVRDPALQRVTIKHSNNVMHRITLPDLWSSSLVCRVLAAFKYILPRDTALLFIARWYSTRNSPGSEDFSAQGEWSLFSRTLLGMVGYDTDKLQSSWPLEPAGSHSPAAVQKKVKTTENGSEKDWEYLLSSQYHRQTSASMSEVLNLTWVGSIADDACSIDNNGLTVSAPLFPHMPAIFFALHLLYEELKCCMLYWELCSLLLPCLCQLAADLRASSYLYHYWRDFPTICSLEGPTLHLSEKNLSLLTMPHYFTVIPPSFLSHISKIMKGERVEAFPYIPEVCPLIRSVLLIFCASAYDCPLTNIIPEKYLKKVSPASRKAFDSARCLSINFAKDAPNMHEKIVLLTDHLGLTNLDVQLLSPGLSLLLINSQHQCRSNPPLGWYGSTYRLINRPDMVLHDQQAAEYNELMIKFSQDAYSAPAQFDGFKSPQANDTSLDSKEVEESYKVDGMDCLDWAVLRLRWPADKRVKDVRHMLNSATPVKIDIKQRLEVSDHEFQEEQERYLFCLCVRTMALPVGRGMFTLSTHTPIITETLPIPPLCLTGKAAPRGTTVDLTNVEVPPNMNMWPLFHNGVASALKVHPSSEGINTSWILFNRPKPGTDLIIEHAGFLLGLGLCGHVSDLSTVGLHEYLSRAHELTSVGLLLGLAAARRGSCHAATTKLLSIHLECLLPPTCTELDIHHTVQVASIMGIGILYQGSGHRHMAEVLMREIGRPPGPEMENSNDRESYSLAAGLGLGLVMFGKGAEPNQFADLDIAGQLYHYIEGGYQKPMTGPTRDKYKSPSYQIKEGKRVNIDVTSPGATLALGMIYFASGNQAVAQWMQAPETNFLLEQIRPDFLLLRIVSWGLIMWQQVVPSIDWVQGNVPNLVLKRIAALEENHMEDPNVDYETMYQAFFNLIAGSCFVLGLKFAGTANDSAFQVLYKYTTLLIRYAKNSTIAIISGKSSMESCMCCCLLSLSLVMAGTGDLEVLRLIRHLRDRVGPLNASVGYGSHMAVHMSLGFLFLGGGRLSISSDNFSVASLLISCFPKLPQHSLDNRYHLQAFRHLYVLACEPRLLIPVDIDSGRLCRAHVTLTMSGCREHPSLSYDEVAPVMLPPLSKLEEISIETDPTNGRFWPLRFTRESSTWGVLEALVRGGYGVALKLREGEAPYPPGQSTNSAEERARVGDMALLRPDKCSLLREQPLPWIAQAVQRQLASALIPASLHSSPVTKHSLALLRSSVRALFLLR